MPYVEGDERGFLTNALIYTVAKRMKVCDNNESPDLILKVCLQTPLDTNIGFRYAEGDERNVVVSDEARLTFIAAVKIIDCTTGCVVKECQKVVASLDYDFESDFSHFGEDTFSLGQLKMYNEARETSQYRLYQILAEKIVDSLLYY